jgi:hypothetical protein
MVKVGVRQEQVADGERVDRDRVQLAQDYASAEPGVDTDEMIVLFIYKETGVTPVKRGG